MTLLAPVIAIVLAAVILGITGRWRWALRPFRIPSEKMTVAKLGLAVRDPANIERVDSILRGFASGFNAMLTLPTPADAERSCDNEPPLIQPFAQEGLAMAFTPRRMFRFDPAIFQKTVVKHRPEFRYLHFVGLGFWSGMSNHSAKTLMRITELLDPLHKYLCFDGYGFQRVFFEQSNKVSAAECIDRLTGYARNVAYQGAGRALWFLHMDAPEQLITRVRQLGSFAADAAAGIGLAAVFVNPDRLHLAQALGRLMPEEWQSHFHLGMCFALKARSINQPDAFESWLAACPEAVQQAAWASIRECDRIELQVRAEGGNDGYEQWRQRVTDWLSTGIEFPMQAVRPVPTRRPNVPKRSIRAS